MATKIMKNEPNCIQMQQPIIIVGDIHGQFYDLLNMFKKVYDSQPK